MSFRVEFNGTAIAGRLIKFSLDDLGSIFAARQALNSDPFTIRVLVLNRGLDESESLQTVPDEDFIPLAPALDLTNDLNNAVLTKGNYAIEFLEDGIFTIVVSEDSKTEVEQVDPIQDILDRVLTQYRESPNFLGIISVYLRQVEDVKEAIREIPSKFNLDTAVGEQLTIIGKWLGFPRCHNVTSSIPVFGFKCDGVSSPFNIQGFCRGATWSSCPGVSSFEVCINDDDLYRRFLYVRRYQLLGKNDYRSFLFCLRILFGANANYTQTNTEINVVTGRVLTNYESSFLQVFERVLPRAPSATINITT